MKKPIDPLEGLTKEEREEKEERVRDLNLSKEEERALIWTAMKVIVLPIVIFFLVAIGLIYLIF